MLNGAWGARAGELVERQAERRGAHVHRTGRLTVESPPHVVVDAWRCWIFGEPSDTGVLASHFDLGTHRALPDALGRALTARGEEACTFLQGRFLLVALDRERDRCLLVRDQLGAHPLVYARVADGVLFAEHERDLLEMLPHVPSPDRLALLQWVEGGHTPRGRTLYEGVDRLTGGHRLVLTETDVRVERWWQLCYEGVEQGTSAALAERVRRNSFAAIGRAASGAKRPAVKLSGGLDSACVAAGLAANGFVDGGALALGGTFSAHPATDESDFIEATASYVHLPLEQVAFEPRRSSIRCAAVEHIVRWRVPPTTPNLFVWQPLMARARALGVDVMLDGEGGDELFGVAHYLIADLLRAGRASAAWALTRRIPGIGLNPGRRARLSVLHRFGLDPLVPVAVQRRRAARRRAVASYSVAPRSDAQALDALSALSLRDSRDGPFWWRFLAESLIDDRDLLGVGAHFRREAADERIDRRHPFLHDLELIETVLRIPPAAQFDPSRDRPLLREALRGTIPELVRTRHTKTHFTSLVLAAIRADESGLIEPLRRSDAPIRAYVAPVLLDRKLQISPADRPILDTGSLWQVAIANQWLLSLYDGCS